MAQLRKGWHTIKFDVRYEDKTCRVITQNVGCDEDWAYVQLNLIAQINAKPGTKVVLIKTENKSIAHKIAGE